jgi:hypothetical protein
VSLSFYTASVPVFERGLQQLAIILDKAVSHAQATGRDPDDFVSARLAPDMFTLAGQVQSASDAAKMGTARLAGVTPPPFPDTETTIVALQARIATTLAFIETVSMAEIDAASTRTISIKLRGEPTRFAAETYLFRLALPNFFFHLTTAYGILRANGVALVKTDYLGSIQ